MRSPVFSLFLLIGLLPGAGHADTRLVRETEAQSAEAERAQLQVPEGFEAQLFASEPQINKPINIAFDGKGRLWVSSTVEYPYSADKARWSDAQGTHVKDSRDAIKILEDTDGDGKADKVTDFADGLNIPTGVLPWHKPEHAAGCIAWSIPNIWYFADTDGNGKADLREVLFGPLGYEKDTHGMCSSFRLGLDGWVYATHGFNNTSLIRAKDGTTLKLHSGNVFRFRPDGSRVELWSAGQVNPFGLCFDRYGNLYSADCHSAPIYQLLRGASYPSFGKPHDGLGFAPTMCAHSHGSTGICGITYIDGGVWGPEWDDHMLVGNVVTSVINHDAITFNGATPKAHEKPDFLRSKDPWFRPVDMHLGPDNALYVADFYNKIIGHYEVPLEHPGRDKKSGRIWRIIKKDAQAPKTDFTALTPQQLAEEIGHPNQTRRRLALQEIRLRGKPDWAPTFLSLLAEKGKELAPAGDARPPGYLDEEPHDANGELYPQANLTTAHALWACTYLGERLVPFRVLRGLHSGGAYTVDSQDPDLSPKDRSNAQKALLMTQAIRAIGSQEKLHPWEQYGLHLVFDHRGNIPGKATAEVLLGRAEYLLSGANEPRGFRGFAVTAVLSLLDGILTTQTMPPSQPSLNPEDVQFTHALRLLVRDFWTQKGVLQHPEVAAWLQSHLQNTNSRPWLMELLQAVPTASAASLLAAQLKTGTPVPEPLWTHLGRHADKAVLDRAIPTARELAGSDIPAQLVVLTALQNGLSERGAPPHPALQQWAQQTAQALLQQVSHHGEPEWIPLPQKGEAPVWSLVSRKCKDGQQVMALQSMKQGGAEEKRTGTLRSKTFPAPKSLSLWMVGHRGVPSAPAHDQNQVRIIEESSGKVLANAFPPRSDVCEPVVLDLSAYEGKTVRLEIVDGDSGGAYAWLGVTRIEPPVLAVETFDQEQSTRQALRTLATQLQHSAPAALREKLAAYLPPRPSPPPLPVSPAQRQQLDELIRTRTTSYTQAKPNLAHGQQVFATHCAACHQIGNQGGLIGPQLDGIGNRGVERLCEDILDPNRNVDAHFHLHTLALQDGSSISGFLKSEVGQVLILADAAGQEHRISRTDLKTETTSPLSLMPPIFGQTLPETDFYDLLGWLLTK